MFKKKKKLSKISITKLSKIIPKLIPSINAFLNFSLFSLKMYRDCGYHETSVYASILHAHVRL